MLINEFPLVKGAGRGSILIQGVKLDQKNDLLAQRSRLLHPKLFASVLVRHLKTVLTSANLYIN